MYSKNSKTLMMKALLIACAGSAVNAQSIDWLAPIDGNWNDTANWNGANIPNSASEDAILGLVGAYTVEMTNSFTIGSLSITNPFATLTTGASTTLSLQGGLTNNGLIHINLPASGFDSHLHTHTDITINGTGSIFLGAVGNPGDAQLASQSGSTLTNSATHTIRGSGTISGMIINDGLINADDPAGSGLKLGGTLTQSAGGQILADAGTLLLGNASTTSGGTINTVNGGQIQVESGFATISDILNTGDINVLGNSHTLAINNTITNNGTITVNSNNANFNAHVRFDTPSTIDGNGNIVLISPSNTGDAQILTGGAFDGIIGANQTIEGSGLINGASGGTIVNNGTFLANNGAGLPLAITGTHRGNGGGLYLADGATLQLSNGLVQDGGTFDSASGGMVEMTSSGVASLYDVTNVGEMGVRGQSGTIALIGPMNNMGTIIINSDNSVFNGHLRFDANDTISGSGLIHMVTAGNVGDAQLITNTNIQGTIGNDQTVDGSGIISGQSGGTIINNGTINGNHAAVGKAPAIQLELRGSHDGQTVGVYRSDDGILGLGNGLTISNAIFDSSGVGIVDMISSGTATIDNCVNIGHMGVRGQSGTISLVSTLTNNGTLTINSDNTPFNGHVRFENSLAEINGTGTVRMVTAGNVGDAQLLTADGTNGTIGADQTVAGSGIIHGVNGGRIINNGTINGDDPTQPLELRGSHDGLGGGVYRSDNGTLALVNNTMIDGGVFDSSGTGIVEHTANGLSKIVGGHNIGTLGVRGQSGTLSIQGMTNDGTIIVNSDGAPFNAHLLVLNGSTISGNGSINMTTAGNSADAQLISEDTFTAVIDQPIVGDGRIVGSFDIFSEINPAGPSRLLDIDDIHMNPVSELIVDLGGTNTGDFDRLGLGGPDMIELDGTITMNLDDGYLPLFGDTWDIISGGTITGMFATENMPDAGLGRVYRVIYEPDRVYIVLTCDVDFSGDGTLNFFDVSAFLALFNAQDLRGDLNNDGSFNFFDISIFLSLFNQSCN